MEKLTMHSPDLTQANIDKVGDLFPTVVTETRTCAETSEAHTHSRDCYAKAVDFDLLRQELSDHVVEGPQERYQLDWPGKREALFAANAPIAKTLRPVREESVEFDTTTNVFIEGDNLDALKLIQESYLGKVKIIYIDPPYNTGNDFIYDDDFAESAREFLERSGQATAEGRRLVSNLDTSGRFHSDWLSMMYPRLKLARDLLHESGIVFVSIDDNELANLRRVMDEVFGSINFFAELVVTRAEGGGLAKRVVKGHDYLVGYARDLSAFKGMFRAKDIRGQLTLREGKQYWIETDWLRREFGKYGTLPYEEIEAVKGIAKKREIDEGLAAGEFVLVPRDRGHIVGRLRPVEEDGSKFYSVLKHLNKDAKNALDPLGLGGLFSNPKPLSLLTELVLGATRFTKSESEIVMDFFAGSGTTGHAVLDANRSDGGNRRYVLVQIPEDLTQTYADSAGPAKETVGRAIAHLTERGQKPVLSALTRARLAAADASLNPSRRAGFRAFRVDSTNMADVLRSPDEVTQGVLELSADSVKDGRTAEDLLFQVILDWGLTLDLPIEPLALGTARVFDVDAGTLVACFDDVVTDAVVRAIAERKPLRSVFKDSAFATDDARINTEQIFREVSPGTHVKVI